VTDIGKGLQLDPNSGVGYKMVNRRPFSWRAGFTNNHVYLFLSEGLVLVSPIISD
jgi:hypothetical protein